MHRSYLYIGIVLVATGLVGAGTTLAAEQGALAPFVELLVGRGIISQDKAPLARRVVSVFEGKAASSSKPIPTTSKATALNAEHISVTVSQLLENGNRTYKRGLGVRGLLLLVHNTSTSTIQLEARRRCQVSYKIFDEKNTLLFDSATVGSCVDPEHVTYLLEAGKTRMFPVSHNDNVYPLAAGTYRFELDYPGYGSGDRTITITP